jgi:hypothetical protein
MTIHVSVAKVIPIANNSSGTPLYKGVPLVAASLSTSGTAASTTTLVAGVGAVSGSDVVCRISSVDAAHYVRIGGTVSATNGYYVPQGGFIELVMETAAEVSAITA